MRSFASPFRAGFLSVDTLMTMAFLFILPAAHAANERDLWNLWETHTSSVDDHDAVITACKSFISQNRRDPLVVVAKGIAAWHLLQQDEVDTAETLLTPYLEGAEGPLEAGAALVARGWISRLDRELLKKPLQGYYRKQVSYPSKLQDLTGHPGVQGLPLWRKTDRWGRPWDYRLAGIKAFPGLFDQSYTLQSPVLKDLSDLEKALTIPYGENIRIKPKQIISSNSATPMVQVSSGAGRASVGMVLGESLDGVTMAYVGPALVIVCDAAHWMVFKRP